MSLRKPADKLVFGDDKTEKAFNSLEENKNGSKEPCKK